MQAKQLLYGIPQIRNDVTRQRCRSGRLDYIKPGGFALHVRQPVKQSEQWKESGKTMRVAYHGAVFLVYRSVFVIVHPDDIARTCARSVQFRTCVGVYLRLILEDARAFVAVERTKFLIRVTLSGGLSILS